MCRYLRARHSETRKGAFMQELAPFSMVDFFNDRSGVGVYLTKH